MSEQKAREKTLRELLEDNFITSRYCRKIMETMADVSLRYYFQSLASRRSQFALELGEEIAYYGGKEPYIPTNAYDRLGNNPEKDRYKALKKALKYHKASLQKYKEALCQIHEGSCREVLIRHKAFLENCVFELKSLKTLLKYNRQAKNGETSTTERDN